MEPIENTKRLEAHVHSTLNKWILDRPKDLEKDKQPVRLLVNDRKFPAGNSIFFSHQISQQ